MESLQLPYARLFYVVATLRTQGRLAPEEALRAKRFIILSPMELVTRTLLLDSPCEETLQLRILQLVRLHHPQGDNAPPSSPQDEELLQAKRGWKGVQPAFSLRRLIRRCRSVAAAPRLMRHQVQRQAKQDWRGRTD